jgi:hypothetical protein
MPLDMGETIAGSLTTLPLWNVVKAGLENGYGWRFSGVGVMGHILVAEGEGRVHRSRSCLPRNPVEFRSSVMR